MQRRGVTGNMVYVVFYREERGGMTTEERGDMMMMVVPTHIFQKKINHISGYYLPSMIKKFTNITSDVSKCVLDDC